jgi:hypothetical protein
MNLIQKANSKSGIELFFENYDWGGMWKELTAEPKLVTCKPKGLDKGFVSFSESTITEPLYLVSATIKKGEIKSYNLSLSDSPDKTGVASDDGGVYVNITKFPIMNLLLKNSTRGALAFEKGSIKPVYIGMFDPKKWDNIMSRDMSPEKLIFSSLKAQLASVVSCIAYSTLDMLPRNKRASGSVSLKLKDTIDLFYFSDGCLGPLPAGTSTEHPDAISNGNLAASSVFLDMFSRKGVVSDFTIKHTTRNILNSHTKKILCEPVINPIFPQSAYTQQLLYPTVGKTHELGVSPAQNNFHGAGESEKLVYFIYSQRRHYAPFAYQE